MEDTCIDDTLAHYWIIEPSGKASSLGRCKRCGMEKKFRNSIPVVINGWNKKSEDNKKEREKENGNSK
jgi:hypothetical protein